MVRKEARWDETGRINLFRNDPAVVSREVIFNTVRTLVPSFAELTAEGVSQIYFGWAAKRFIPFCSIWDRIFYIKCALHRCQEARESFYGLRQSVPCWFRKPPTVVFSGRNPTNFEITQNGSLRDSFTHKGFLTAFAGVNPTPNHPVPC